MKKIYTRWNTRWLAMPADEKFASGVLTLVLIMTAVMSAQ